MKVLHLAGNLEDAGGILSVIRHLQTATKDQGWQHSVFVNRCYVETRQPVLDYRTSRFVCSEMASHWRILWRAALALIEAKRLVAREPFAVIHAHSRCGFLIAWGLAAWLNRPVVFTNHDYARRVRMYQRAASHPNFYTVFLTPNMARHYALTEQPPKVSVISACFSDQYFHEPLAGAAMACREGTILRLVGAGSLLRWKKWDLLVRALRRLGESERKQIEVSIWGSVVQSDPDSRRYEAELRQQILTEGLGERVRLRGTTHAMSEAMRQADWFVLPSTNEPCSVALMEALALGLPALVSASGGNVDIVRDGETGCFFAPDNVTHLTQQLRAILNSQMKISPPGRIRESVRERSASAVGWKYDELYRRVAQT